MRKFKADDDASGKLSAVISDFQIVEFLDVLFSAKNKDGNDEIYELFGDNEFDYAKPEKLIKSILEVTTVEGDIVLDFLPVVEQRRSGPQNGQAYRCRTNGLY